MSKVYINYNTLEQDTLSLAEKIKKADVLTSDTQLVCVSRGGLFTGAILAYALNLKDVYCVSLESYVKEENGGNEEVICRTSFLPHLDGPYGMTKPDQRPYLIVDDINDTSNTYMYISRETHRLDLNIIFATTYHKPRDKNLTPDFYGREIDASNWVVFPWDQMKNI